MSGAEVLAGNRVNAAFRRLRGGGRRGLVPFVVGGHPSLGVMGPVLRALAGAGADVIEVGLPFSDPIADGPVIAEAMHGALSSGVSLEGVLEGVAAARGGLDAAVVAMTSVSLVHRSDAAVFMRRLSEAGFDGVIVPDAPLEESGPLVDAAGDAGLTATLLVAPTTPVSRAAAIAGLCTGFVYLLARAGITGERDASPDAAIGERVAALRGETSLPIACGFGISTAEHARVVTRYADAAIVGSALVRRLAVAGEDGAAAEAGRFAGELRRAIDA